MINSNDIGYIHLGVLFVIMLYSSLNFIVLKHKIYISTLLYAAVLFSSNIVFQLQSIDTIQHVLIGVSYLIYFDIVYYWTALPTNPKTQLTNNTLLLMVVVLQLLVVFSTTLMSIYPQILLETHLQITKGSILLVLLLYLYKTIGQQKKIKSIHISIIFCMLGMACYYPINSIEDNTFFKTIALLQFFFIFDTSIEKYYSYDKEKEVMNDTLFMQMQENYLYYIRVKQIKEDIKGNLHDDLGSQLSLVNSLGQLAAYYINKDNEKVASYIKNMHQELEAIPLKIKNIIDEDPATLQPILTNKVLFEQTAAILFDANAINYTFTIHDTMKWEEIEDHTIKNIFLVYKEVLVNIIRHSKATKVGIDLRMNPQGKIKLVVEDNGIGFDTTSITTKGYGLYSIKRRIESLKGKITILSPPAKGTLVVAEI